MNTTLRVQGRALCSVLSAGPGCSARDLGAGRRGFPRLVLASTARCQFAGLNNPGLCPHPIRITDADLGRKCNKKLPNNKIKGNVLALT